MAWPMIMISDLSHFSTLVAHVGTFGPAVTTAYVCRGQSVAAWGLRPSLGRLIDPLTTNNEATRIEEDCVAVFSERAHLHVPSGNLPAATDRVGWLALMQHHHAPTRLLDWTASPLIAAYFACEDRWSEDGVIWLVHLHALTTTRGNQNPKLIRAFWPSHPSSRMVAQQGLFMYAEDVMTDHESQLDALLAHEHASGGGEVYRKIVIPHQLKPQILRYLRTMNVTAASLFPGADGLGRAAHELARLAAVFPREIDRLPTVP